MPALPPSRNAPTVLPGTNDRKPRPPGHPDHVRKLRVAGPTLTQDPRQTTREGNARARGRRHVDGCQCFVRPRARASTVDHGQHQPPRQRRRGIPRRAWLLTPLGFQDRTRSGERGRRLVDDASSSGSRRDCQLGALHQPLRGPGLRSRRTTARMTMDALARTCRGSRPRAPDADRAPPLPTEASLSPNARRAALPGALRRLDACSAAGRRTKRVHGGGRGVLPSPPRRRPEPGRRTDGPRPSPATGGPAAIRGRRKARPFAVVRRGTPSSAAAGSAKASSTRMSRRIDAPSEVAVGDFPLRHVVDGGRQESSTRAGRRTSTHPRTRGCVRWRPLETRWWTHGLPPVGNGDRRVSDVRSP